MPFRSKEDKLAYQRAWYAANRERVIAKVAERKRTLYAGTCRNCGGPTMGMTKKRIPEWCSRPQCASVHRQLRKVEFATYGRGQEYTQSLVEWKHNPVQVVWQGDTRIFCSCGWAGEWFDSNLSAWADSVRHTRLFEKERRPDAR